MFADFEDVLRKIFILRRLSITVGVCPEQAEPFE